MTQYQLKIKGEVKTSGSFRDCWKALLALHGDKSIVSLSAFGVIIKPKQ